MTAAIGPGTRVRFIGWANEELDRSLVIGRVYTVSDVVDGGDTHCSYCMSKTGIFLYGQECPRPSAADVAGFAPDQRFCWCPCGFRPADDEPDAVAQAREIITRAPPLPVRPKTPEPA
jgi:hypothetical protein